MSDLDIAEAMRKSSSAKRYQPTTNASNRTPQQPLRVARASRATVEQPLVTRNTQQYDTTSRQRRTSEYTKPKMEAPRRITQAYQEQRPYSDVDTDADVEIAQSMRPRSAANAAPPTRELPPLRQKSRRQMHWLVPTGIGMLGMLAVWLVVVQVMVVWTNGFGDPGHYTQTAHLDVVTVKMDTQGHQSQVRAFLDAQGHVDMLILPVGGDTSKARVVVGPALSPLTDLQKALITVTAKGTVVTILIEGPLETNYFTTIRKSSTWTLDLKPASGKGGH